MLVILMKSMYRVVYNVSEVYSDNSNSDSLAIIETSDSSHLQYGSTGSSSPGCSTSNSPLLLLLVVLMTLPANILWNFCSSFLTDDLLERIVEETNKYASDFIESNELPSHSRVRRWKPCNLEEMKIFLAITIVMTEHFPSKM